MAVCWTIRTQCTQTHLLCLDWSMGTEHGSEGKVLSCIPTPILNKLICVYIQNSGLLQTVLEQPLKVTSAGGLSTER